jgi:CheY-like chemotaxis protein
VIDQVIQTSFSNHSPLHSKPSSPQQNVDLPQKVLIIDDDAVPRYTIATLLSQLSCASIEAKDGYEGLYRARTQQPNAIVLDLLMPGIDGFEVLTALKTDPLTRSIPVIIMTSKQLSAEEFEQLTQNPAFSSEDGTPAAGAIAVLPKYPGSSPAAIASTGEAIAPRYPQGVEQLRTALLDAGLNLLGN